MADRLPSLNALRALEAAARHLSFSRAAEELHVTPTAISHQIRGLEEYLGVSLFHRHPRGLSLSNAAQRSLPRLQEGFSALSDAVQQLQQSETQQTLTLLAPPSFAATWLMPRLPRFTEQHPGMDFSIEASSMVIGNGPKTALVVEALQAARADLAIGFSEGYYPGCRVTPLLTSEVIPVCSPTLLTGPHPLREPQDLRHHSLIHDDTAYEGRPDWPHWLKAAGVGNIPVDRGLHFNHVSLALQAARDGQGVVLSIRALAAEDLAAGRLVAPFSLSLPLELQYFLVCQESEAQRQRVAPLWNWLQAEAR